MPTLKDNDDRRPVLGGLGIALKEPRGNDMPEPDSVGGQKPDYYGNAKPFTQGTKHVPIDPSITAGALLEILSIRLGRLFASQLQGRVLGVWGPGLRSSILIVFMFGKMGKPYTASACWLREATAQEKGSCAGLPRVPRQEL